MNKLGLFVGILSLFVVSLMSSQILGATPACTNEFLTGNCLGSITYTHSNTLTGNVMDSSGITINSGVIITTAGYIFVTGGTFNNQGTINTGSASNGGAGSSSCAASNAQQGGDFSNSYAGSGGGGSGQNGGSTQGGGNGANDVGAMTISNPNIVTWFSNGFYNYISAAGGGGGGSYCGGNNGYGAIGGNTLVSGGAGTSVTSGGGFVAGGGNGGSGDYGIYIQGLSITAGTINANGGNGDVGGYGAGGGGGAIVILAYSNGGTYTSGTYSVGGGTGGSASGVSGGTGGTGAVETYAYSSQPIISPQLFGTLTISPNSINYGSNSLITYTCPSGTDICAIDEGMLSNQVAVNAVGDPGSVSYTANYFIYAPGTFSFWGNDLTISANSVSQTLTINKAPVLLTLNNCGNQNYISTGYSCSTTGQQSNSLFNQVLANLNLNGASVGTATTTTNTISYLIANSVNENIFILSEAGNGNYLSNTLTTSWFGYVPINVKNVTSTNTLIPTNGALTLASNTLTGWHNPFEIYVNPSPSSSITYTIQNAFAANAFGSTIPVTSGVANLIYFGDVANDITGTWMYLITESQYGNTISANQLFNPLTQGVVLVQPTNGIYTCIQYFPCAVNSLSFFSRPTSYKIDGVANILPDSAVGNGINVAVGTNSLTLPLNVQAIYSQFSPTFTFNLTWALGLTTNTLPAISFNLFTTNSAPIAPYTREVFTASTYDQHNLQSLATTTVELLTGLFNNWIVMSQSTFTGNSFQTYMPLSNFQNPALSVTSLTLSSSAASHFLANNNYCPTVLTNGNYMTLKPYLVDLNGSLYTFNIYSGYSTVGGGDFMWIMDGIQNSSAINVQQVQIQTSPFALALENGQSYSFRFYSPNCNLISASNYSIWSNPITLNIPSNANVPLVRVPNVTTSCTKNFLTYNTASITCTGTDTTDLVSSWSMKLYNVSSISGWYQFNSLNSTTASFMQTFSLVSNFSPLKVIVTWSGSGFQGAQPYFFNQNVIQGGLSLPARGFIVLLALLVGLGIGVAGAKSGTIEAVHAPSTTIIIEALIIVMLYMTGLLNPIPVAATIGIVIVMIFVAVQSHRHESGGG